MRPRSPPCCATCALVPQMISSTSAVSMPVRSASARNTVAPSCCGWIPDRAPFPALPMPRGVLQASMISASTMAFPLLFAFLDPLAAGANGLPGFGGASGEAVQEMVHDHVRKLSRTDTAGWIVPGVTEVQDAEQHHRVDLPRPLCDLAILVETDEKVRHRIDDLPLQRLDGFLLGLAEERQVVQNHTLLVRRVRIELDDGADRGTKLIQRRRLAGDRRLDIGNHL